MKESFLLGFLLLTLFSAHAQWGSDIRLTNDPDSSGTSYNTSWSIATQGDSVHVTWQDKRDGAWDIYYKHSIDGGLTWGQDIR